MPCINFLSFPQTRTMVTRAKSGLKSKNKKTENIDDVEKLKPSCTATRNIK